MNEAINVRSIVVKRDIPYSSEKIWRALTESQLIEEWLMKNDFQLIVGHKFNFRSKPMMGWNGVTDCEVLEIIPQKRLAYTWNASGEQAANGLKTIVTWILKPRGDGTSVHMEQAGFRPQDEAGFCAMGSGWPHILGMLEDVAANS